jgi:hypothetical protein
MPNTSLVSFEDYIDFAYNDLSFSFTNVGTVFCPEGIATLGRHTTSANTGHWRNAAVYVWVRLIAARLILNTATGDRGTPTARLAISDFEARATGSNGVAARANCRITVIGSTPTTGATWGKLKIRYR